MNEITAYNARKFEEEGNPMYPLPPDYADLTDEGKRLARVNACCYQKTPYDFVVAWDFFRRTHLMPTPAGFFYGDDLVESPALHYDLVHATASHQFVIRGFPRGFAKSTLCDEILLLLSLTRPGWPTSICLASDTLVEDRFTIYQNQYTQNEFIINDFGSLKPNRGEGKFSLHRIMLKNKAIINGFATESRKRGTKPRPRLLILDDPEFDTKANTDMTKLQNEFQNLLFQQLMPMGEIGMSILWTGTILSHRSMLCHACTTLDDPRFSEWNKTVVGAMIRDETGMPVPLWEEHLNAEQLRKLEMTMGKQAFASEMMNNPTIGEGKTFNIDPNLCTYFVKDKGPYAEFPLSDTSELTYRVKNKRDEDSTQKTAEYGEFVSKLHRMMFMDYASTVSATSDYSCIIVVGFEAPYDVLWVLDVYVAKVKEDVLIRKLVSMGQKWLPSIVGIEAVSIQQRVYEIAESIINDYATQERTGWYPRVLPVKYAGSRTPGNKQQRISGIEWRFNNFRIKFPTQFRQKKYWKTLFDQVEDFQADLQDGGLRHDDAVDTLAMHQALPRAKNKGGQIEDRRSSSPIDCMLDGNIIDPETGLSYMGAISASDITSEQVRQLLASNDTVFKNRNLSSGFIK